MHIQLVSFAVLFFSKVPLIVGNDEYAITLTDYSFRDNVHPTQSGYLVSNHSTAPRSNNCFRLNSFDRKEWVMKEHSLNYWHVTFGFFVPIVTEIYRCRKFSNSSEWSTNVIVEIGGVGWSEIFQKVLYQCMALVMSDRPNMVHVEFVAQLQSLNCSKYDVIKRCDIPGHSGRTLPVPRVPEKNKRTNLNLKYALSYFDTCQKENTFMKFRNYVAELTPNTWGSNANIPHSANESGHVLIIMRKCKKQLNVDRSLLGVLNHTAERDELDIHIHHSICFENNTKLQSIIKEFASSGFSSHVAYMDNVTVIEQANLFSGASIILLPHGAEIANGLYARSGTLFVEITPYFEGITHLPLHKLIQTQSLLPKRNMLQSLAKYFWSEGVYMSHIALPALPALTSDATGEQVAPSYDIKVSYERGGVSSVACSIWSCLSPKLLVQHVVKRYEKVFKNVKT